MIGLCQLCQQPVKQGDTPIMHGEHLILLGRAVDPPLLRIAMGQGCAQPQRALACQAVVISFTLGWESYEANGPMRKFLSQIMDFDTTFETGLDALVRGLGA